MDSNNSASTVRMSKGNDGLSKRYNYYTIDSEHDPKKSQLNKTRHGIDFLEAKALWLADKLEESAA
jgi:hypothetical protein